MPDKPNEGFVSRWSRRKQEVTEVENKQDFSDNSSSSEKVVIDDIDPEILKAEKLEALNKLTDEDMPDIETLDENSDFSGFMSTSVSEGLRNIALKKLFMGKSYNIRDGLDEYDGDYTKFEKMPKSMVTSDMKHMVEVEAKKKLEKEQEEARQKMLAENDVDEMEEFDEFADEEDGENNEVAADSSFDNEEELEDYVDEHINVEGFDTRVADGAKNDTNNEEVA